jgi:hypothetical protein
LEQSSGRVGFLGFQEAENLVKLYGFGLGGSILITFGFFSKVFFAQTVVTIGLPSLNTRKFTRCSAPRGNFWKMLPDKNAIERGVLRQKSKMLTF